MKTIKLTIAYDGAGYSGWQIQPNAVTVQGLIQQAVRRMTGEKNNLVGAGRTDAGVHALGQVASFRTESKIPLKGFERGLNSELPPDIRVLDAEKVLNTFHPIRDSKAKNYSYIFSEDAFLHPLNNNRLWPVGRKMDLKKMNEALRFIVGEHDFSSFRAADKRDDHSVRRVLKARITEFTDWKHFPVIDNGMKGSVYKFDIKGEGFLKNMVRNIVGTIVQVGIGKISVTGFKKIVDAKDRKKAGICAPACGLYLVFVKY